MRMPRVASWAALLFAVSVLPASATFHLMKIVELFPGTAASPSAHYVVLQMYASGQQFVYGHALTVYNASGQPVGNSMFDADVGNGANQATILIATPQAEAFFDVSADLAMDDSLIRAGGKVCFAGDVDCVAWGSYSGGSAGVGTPFNAATGLQPGQAVLRRLNLAGSASTLDAGDDTGNSATDFVAGLPMPRNNAGQRGTIPGSTCGNHLLEGLEQCDDGNLASGDGCSSTCALDEDRSTPPLAAMSGDFNGDGRADVFWRNAANGANAIWLSANNATRQATPRVSNLDWSVVGIGHFDAGTRSDVFWRNGRTGANTIWKSGNAATPQAVVGVGNVDWKVVGIGDFNGDARSDVFWRNGRTGANTIWLGANAQTQQATARVANLDWQVVGTGDFDADARADVLWRNGRTGANAIWRSGNQATPRAIAAVTNLRWQIVGIGDFDGDGRDDLFWRHSQTGANVVWRSASSTTALATAGVGNLSWKVVQAGNYNGGDARDDVLWRNAATGANVIWRSANAGTSQGMAAVTNLDWRVVP